VLADRIRRLLATYYNETLGIYTKLAVKCGFAVSDKAQFSRAAKDFGVDGMRKI